MEFTSVANTAILMNALRTLPVNRAAMDRMPAQALQSLTLPPPKGGEPAPPSGTIQIVVDAWKNPIIFVPGTAEIGSVAVPGTYDGPKGLLIGRIYNNTAQYRDGQYVISNDVSYRCIQATVGNAPPNATYWQPMPAIAAPNNRPFFASAGPDGDFSKGDDNIYSFEQ